VNRSNSIGLVTDSSSQITSQLVDRFNVVVVPMTVTVDGEDFEEGVNLDADGFYDLFAGGTSPEITTSQPSPGRFGKAYEQLFEAGCDEIISIHIAEAMSGTIASATLAARSASVPVHVIDTGTASFGVALCTWLAGSSLERGAAPSEIPMLVEEFVTRLGTAFMVGVPHLTERGGRADDVDIDADAEGIPVLAMSGGQLEVLDRVSTVEDTIDVMSTYTAGWGSGTSVAIGTADGASRPLGERLEQALSSAVDIESVVRYRVGPSVGAHTGPGTFGLFVFPTISG
jgi:DegV family protein with EDD domain